MLRLYSQIKGLPIMSLREGREIGAIGDLIIDPDSGRLLAYLEQGRRWFGGPQIIAASDLREISGDLAIVDAGDVLTPPSEIVRVEEILSQRITIIGSSVVTEGGSKLGRVRDYAVDVMGHSLERLHLGGNLLSRELIISRDQIIKIERREIIVRDQTVPDAEKTTASLKVPGALESS